MKYVVYGAGAVGGVIGGLRLDAGTGVAEVAAPATDTAGRVSRRPVT